MLLLAFHLLLVAALRLRLMRRLLRWLLVLRRLLVCIRRSLLRLLRLLRGGAGVRRGPEAAAPEETVYCTPSSPGTVKPTPAPAPAPPPPPPWRGACAAAAHGLADPCPW